MEKKKIITIAGKLGSGKSSAAKLVAKELHLTHFSSGDFLRKVSESRGMTIGELMLAAESDSKIDNEIDSILKNMENQENLIIDSRLAYYWIPNSFKVYLEIDPDIAAERMFYNLKENEERKRTEDSENIQEMKEKMITRHQSDIKRYQKLYGIDHTNHKNFNLVINTGKPENNLEVVVSQIIKEYLRYLES